MKKLFKLSGLISISFAVGGCAGGLSVNVDVLDTGYLSYLNQSDDLRSDARNLALADFTQTERFLTGAREGVESAANSKCHEVARKSLPLITDASKKSMLERSLKNAEGRAPILSSEQKFALQSMRRQLNQIDSRTSSELNRLYGTSPWIRSSQYSVPQPAIQLVANRRSFFEQARIHRDSLIQEAAVGCVGLLTRSVKLNPREITSDLLVETVTTEVKEAIVDTIVGGGSLISEKQGAFHVANAPEQYWAPSFNKAFGKGQFGSTSTAIKINGVADYTVKGFSFDGRSTASMIRKLTVPTVGFAAAMAGIPVDLNASSDSSQGTDSFDTNLITSADAEIAAIEAKEEIHKRAVKNIANVIMAYKSELQLAGDSAEKKRAKSTIKATFEANSSTLE